MATSSFGKTLKSAFTRATAPIPAATLDYAALGRYLASLQTDQTDPGATDSGAVDYGGGSAVGAAPAMPAYDPNTDPAYLQLLSQLDLAGSQARTQADQQTAEAKLQGTIGGPRIAEQGIQTRRGIDLGWEGRGLYRSGARLRDLALQRQTEGQRTADLERGVANSVSSIQRNLDAKMTDLARQRAAAMFDASARATPATA